MWRIFEKLQINLHFCPLIRTQKSPFCVVDCEARTLCVIAGFRSALWDACQSKNAAELTPKYPDFICERVYALSDATRWWHEYGKDALSHI